MRSSTRGAPRRGRHDDVELGAFLGTGGFGDAFEPAGAARGCRQAAPYQEDDDASDAAASAPAAALSAIALALADVRHAHLVRVLGCRTEPPRRFVVVERAPLGSLHDVVHNGKVRALSGAQAAVLATRRAGWRTSTPTPPSTSTCARRT